MEFYLAVFHGFEGYLGKVFHLEEPLHREFRLDGHVCAFGVAHFVVVVLHFLEQCGGVEVFHNLFAYRLACHAYVHACGFAEGGVVVEYVDAFEVVFFAKHIVVNVVGGGYLEASRSEFDVHVAVLDNGDGAVHQRHYHFLAPQPLVFGVGGVYTHCRVAHDGFGTCRCHDGVATAFVVGGDNLAFVACGAGAVVVGNVVAEVEQFAVFVFKYNFLVAEGGEGFWVPVYHTYPAVYQSFVVKVHESVNHAARAYVVHGEGGAVPVAGGAEAFQLFKDDAAVFVGPVPSMFEEFLTSDVVFLDTLLCQFVHHFGFGGDGCMVGAGYPAGVFAQQTGATHQHVLYGVVEHVSHVQHTCYVGWRYHHSVGFATVGFGAEKSEFLPLGVPAVLY